MEKVRSIAILSYPLLDQQAGEEKFAALTYLHANAQNPICGSAHSVASPEMLYVSGSSGTQYDERARRLRGKGDTVQAVIEATISIRNIAS